MPGGRFARLVMEKALGRCPADTCELGEVFYIDDDSTKVACDSCAWSGYDEQILGQPEGVFTRRARYLDLERLSPGVYQTPDMAWRVHRVDSLRWNILHRRSRQAPYVLTSYADSLREAIDHIAALEEWHR